MVRCRPCGILSMSVDRDLRNGYYSGTVQFGPNQAAGQLDETFVSGYRVRFGDALGVPLPGAGALLAEVPALNISGTCCEPAYSAQAVGVLVPADAASVVVVSVDYMGNEMPVGATTGLTDVTQTTTTTTPVPLTCCATGLCPCVVEFGSEGEDSGAWKITGANDLPYLWACLSLWQLARQ